MVNISTILTRQDEASANSKGLVTMAANKICVIGLGYIGLPTAAMFASSGKSVVGVDVNESAVATINRGEIHIVEPDLDERVREAVASGHLRAVSVPEPADVFIIAVPTPIKGDQREPDITYVKEATDSIANVLRPGNIIILESTSPVRTTEQMAARLAGARPDLTFPHEHGDASDVRIAYCPERVLPGKILHELSENDRIIGGLSQRCSDEAVDIYKTFVNGGFFKTDARTAEMAKLTENSFRDVNIAFANEIGLICDHLGINKWELIRLANRHPRVNILRPGPGVGGHCIAVDPWFIVHSAPEQARLIRAAREINDYKPDYVLAEIEKRCKGESDVKICCLGLSFKPDIDDLRSSPAMDIVEQLCRKQLGHVMVVEPNIDSLPDNLSGADKRDLHSAIVQSDIVVGLVAHSAFVEASRNPDFMETLQGKTVIDVCGLWA